MKSIWFRKQEKHRRNCEERLFNRVIPSLLIDLLNRHALSIHRYLILLEYVIEMATARTFMKNCLKSRRQNAAKDRMKRKRLPLIKGRVFPS
jgi:hypothetical protein